MLGLQYFILRIPAVRKWAGILPPPVVPKSQTLENKTFKESAQYILKSIKDYGSGRIEQVEKNQNVRVAVAKERRNAEVKIIKPRKN